MKKATDMKHMNMTALVMMVLTMAIWGCTSNGSEPIDLEHYRPNSEFVEAYEAISKEPEPGATYDLEKTIRVINAIELAQAKSESFDEFLDIMAHQDYRGVDPRILDAKRKLFPIMQRTYDLQHENAELSDAWMIMRGAARGGETLMRNMSASEAFRLLHGDVFALLGVINGEDGRLSTDEAFKQYEEDKELKSKILADLEELRGLYRQYMEDYTPIYNDFMDEYDKLCLKKDNAYRALYSGQAGESLRLTNEILRDYPNNSEAMLLNAMSDLMIGVTENAQNPQQVRNGNREVLLPDSLGEPEEIPMNSHFSRAQQTLRKYKEQNSKKTAPASLLEGLLALQLGNEAEAIDCFKSASTEYPQQAAQLTDMLDSYNMRVYLKQTAEGLFLRNLYASTVEGSGLFSPEFQMAKYYADKGEKDKSQEQIHNHFFRRLNQGVYDGLLSDMMFGEEYLYSSFNDLLFEPSYIDVEVEPESEWLFWDSDNIMHVEISNHSDVPLENVRVMLCIHYTDMHQDEYDVIKVPKTCNRLEAHSTFDMDTVGIYYRDKTFNDITRIRAIIVADKDLCWVDNVKYRKDRIIEALRGGRSNDSEQLEQARDEYLRSYQLDSRRLLTLLKTDVKVLPPEEDPTEEQGWWDSFIGWFSSPDNDLKIVLPRVLAKAHPLFTLNPIDHQDVIEPRSNEIYGTEIRLEFDYEPALDEILTLYIYNDVENCKVEIKYRGSQSEIVSVEKI